MVLGAFGLAGCGRGSADRGPGDEGPGHEDDADDWALAHVPPRGPDGPWSGRAPGNVAVTGAYRDGKPDGRFEARDGDVLVAEATFLAGQFQGEAKTYYPDGTLKEVGPYERGEATGTWTLHYPDGSPFEVLEQKDGEPHGAFTMYFPGHRVADRMTFERGQQVGTEQNYGLDGTLLAEGTFEGDRPTGTWRCHDAGGVREIPAPRGRQTPRQACGYGDGPESPEDFARFSGTSQTNQSTSP